MLGQKVYLLLLISDSSGELGIGISKDRLCLVEIWEEKKG